MSTVKNERGIALVVALIMLVLLSILGMYALSTSSTELFITGNYRNKQHAFYAATAGIERGQEYAMDHTKILPGTAQSCWPAPPVGQTCLQSTNAETITLDDGKKAEVKVTWIRTGLPPAGYDQDKWDADYFIVTSQGTGPGEAVEELESYVVGIRSKE